MSAWLLDHVKNIVAFMGLFGGRDIFNIFGTFYTLRGSTNVARITTSARSVAGFLFLLECPRRYRTKL